MKNCHYDIIQWNQKSSVRSTPLRGDNLSESVGLPFSPKLVPLANHPMITEDPKCLKTVLGYRLLRSLQAIKLIELDYVFPVCREISLGRLVDSLTFQQRQTALLIATDECYHAVSMEKLTVEAACGYDLDRSLLEKPQFVTYLEKVTDENQLSPILAALFFCFVSETLVTGLMDLVPKDTQVVSVVRQVFGDHAQDEGFHCTYFMNIFEPTWKFLNTDQRETLGRVLPGIIISLVSSDKQFDRKVLKALSFSDRQANAILDEVYADKAALSKAARQSANKTIRMFNSAGMLYMPSVFEAFAEEGLISALSS